MTNTPTADTHSPWYEAFTPANGAQGTRWLPTSTFPAPAVAAQSAADDAEDQSATDALFECYNG